MAPRPILGDIELEKVQSIIVDGDQVLVEHGVPALEGDFLQRIGRRAAQINVRGFLTGPEVMEGLKALRDKFRAAEPVPFVADIATATQVGDVLIEEMGVREIAGKPERFEYAFLLREFIPPPATTQIEPPDPVIPPVPEVENGELIVEVIVEGRPEFDFSTVTVTVEGTEASGADLPLRQLTNRTGNRWTEENFPPGTYVARAVTENPPMAGSADAQVRAGQQEQVTIILRPDEPKNIANAFVVHFHFDKAFIEPCMRMALAQVVDYADNHSDEKLLIVGHTDESGSASYNQSLSERRARSVFALLTFGVDAAARAAAINEWNNLRKNAGGLQPSINDTWSTREYQYMLHDLRFYSGNINGVHDASTDEAVREFQTEKGLFATGVVDDATWLALIENYLDLDQFAIPESQFLPNAKNGCDSGILKWLGCGEKMPLPSTPRGQCSSPAWRPNRRTEMVFVKVDSLPCEIPQPVTFNLPAPGAVNPSWCLGPGNPNARCCFATRDPEESDKILIQPGQQGTVMVRGSIKFEDGTPLANAKYVLIAPDGEFMDGEKICTHRKGTAIPGRTAADGSFAYPDKPKGPGVYTLEIELSPPQVARLAEDPISEAKGTVVCKKMDGSSDLDVIIVTQTLTVVALEFVDAANIEATPDTASVNDMLRVRADVRNFQGNEFIIEVDSRFDNIPPVTPVSGSLSFVNPADVDNELESAAIGDTFRLRADIPDITGDEIVIEISDFPGG